MDTPHLPTGFDAEANFHQKVHGGVFGMPRRIRTSATVKASYTPRGIFLHAKPSKGSAPASPISYQVFHFKQSFGDYILTTEGVAIAKPAPIRNSITSKLIYGVTFGYSYPHNPAHGGPSADYLAYLYRVSSLPGTTQVERQGLTPDYAVGDVIEAIKVDPTNLVVLSDPLDTVTSPGGTPQSLTWVELRDRYWTRFADQGFGT